MSGAQDGPFLARVVVPAVPAVVQTQAPAVPAVIKVVTPGPPGAIGPPGDLSEASIRTVSDPAPARLSASDRIVVLDGPSAVILPGGVQGIVQILLKDSGSVEQHDSVPITAQDGALIDGQPSLTFINPGQAATLTFVAGTGWIIT